MKFLHKNVSHGHNLAKIIEKNELFSGGKTAQNPNILGCFYSLWVFEG